LVFGMKYRALLLVECAPEFLLLVDFSSHRSKTRRSIFERGILQNGGTLVAKYTEETSLKMIF
jgi:hypothetical protein